VNEVRLFAALREEAGASRVRTDGDSVGAIVEELSARYGERFARIADAGTFVVNGERAGRETAVVPGDEVALLPPVSGG